MEIVKEVNSVIAKYNNDKENLIQITLELQQLSGKNYIPEEWIEHVAKAVGAPLNKVYETISFYSLISTKPRGKYVVELCKSAPCYVTGAYNLLALIEEELGIKHGETTSDGLFTLELSNCFGACDIAPAIKIGDQVYGKLTKEKIKEIFASLRGGKKS